MRRVEEDAPEIVVQGTSDQQRRAVRRHQRHARSRRAQQQSQLGENGPLETVPEVTDIDYVDPADETEERDYFAPPSSGPHMLIEHSAFRFFWGVFFGRAEHVKTSAFCSALLKYLAMPTPAAGAEQPPGVLPLPPLGLGLPEGEIVQLDRGSPRSTMDGLVLALDLDESGRISAAMLGRALLSLPANTSLRDAVYLLAEQRGRVLLPAPTVVSAAYVRGLVRSLQALGPGQDKCQDLYSPFALHGEDAEVLGGRGAVGPRGSDGEGVQDRLEANMRVPGWSLLGGAPGMGRTARAVAACRAVLHSLRMQDPYAAPSVAAAVSVSQALLDPLSSSSSTAQSIAQLGALHRLDALYLDFRAASSRAEVLAAAMAQLGLSGCAVSLRAAELRLGRLLASLKPGSVLLLDHVSADCCSVLTTLLDPFSAVLSLVVVTGAQSRGEVGGEGDERGGDAAVVELMDELGPRLVSPHQGSVNIAGPLSRDESLRLARRFFQARAPGEEEPLPLLEAAAHLCGGCPGLLRLLVSAPALPILPALSALLCAPPLATSPTRAAHRSRPSVAAEDVFFHPAVLGPDDKLVLLALLPLRGSRQEGGSQRLPFSADLAWHLCRGALEASQVGRGEEGGRERFSRGLEGLLAAGWLEPAGKGLLSVSSLAHSCPLPAHHLEALEDSAKQWDLYSSYWAEQAVKMDEALLALADQEDRPGPSLAQEALEGPSRHLLAAALDTHFPHLFRLLSLWLSDGADSAGVSGVPGALDASVDVTHEADRTIGDSTFLGGAVLEADSQDQDVLVSPKKLAIPSAMLSRSASADAQDALSPTRMSASLHLSVLNASQDALDEEVLSRVRSMDRLERERDVKQQREQERERRRRRRTELRRRHASDEREATQQSKSQLLVLTLAGRVGALCASRLSERQSVELTRSLVLAAHNADAQAAQEGRPPDGYRSTATLEAYIDFGRALLRSQGPADLEEARCILKAAAAMADARDPLQADMAPAASPAPPDTSHLLLPALFHYGRSLLNLPADPLDHDDLQAEGAYGEETSAEELGGLVLDQVAFRLRAAAEAKGGDGGVDSWQRLLLADTLALQGAACVRALRRLQAQGLQGLVTVSPFGVPSPNSSSPAGGARGGHGSLQERGLELLSRGRALLLEARTLHVSRSGELSLRGCEMLVHLGALLSCDVDRRAEAKTYLEQCLGLLNKRGEGSVPATAHALSLLARLIELEPGREGLTRLLLEEALNAFKRCYPSDSPLVTAAATALGSLLTTQMRYDRAIVLYDEALAAARRAVSAAVGKQDAARARAALPPVLVTLAALHDKTGRYALALSLYRDAISCYRELHGENHKAVAETLCLLAECVEKYGQSAGQTLTQLPDQGQAMDRGGSEAGGVEGRVVFREDRYEEAQGLASQALGVFRTIDGSYSPSVVRTLRLKARMHQAHGQLTSAKACFEQIMACYQEAQLGFTEDLAEAQHAFADLLCRNEEPVEAMALYQLSAVVYRRLFGDTDARVAEVTLGQAQCLLDLDQHEEAQPVVEEALGMFQRLLGPESPRCAECFHCLGLIFQALEERQEAKEAYRVCVLLRIRAHGETHMEVAQALNNLASVHDEEDELEEASRLYDQALQILRRLHGDESPLVLLAMDNLLSVLEDRGARDEALVLEGMLSRGADRMVADKRAEEATMGKHLALQAKRRAQNQVLQQAREAEAYREAYPEEDGGAAVPPPAAGPLAQAAPLDPASPPPVFSPPASALSLPPGARILFADDDDDDVSPLAAPLKRPPRNSYAHMLGQQNQDPDAPPPIREDVEEAPAACTVA